MDVLGGAKQNTSMLVLSLSPVPEKCLGWEQDYKHASPPYQGAVYNVTMPTVLIPTPSNLVPHFPGLTGELHWRGAVSFPGSWGTRLGTVWLLGMGFGTVWSHSQAPGDETWHSVAYNISVLWFLLPHVRACAAGVG